MRVNKPFLLSSSASSAGSRPGRCGTTWFHCVCACARVVGFAPRSCGCGRGALAAADRWRNVVQSIAVGRRATCARSYLARTYTPYTHGMLIIIVFPTTDLSGRLYVFGRQLRRPICLLILRTRSAAPGSSTRPFFCSFSSAPAASIAVPTPPCSTCPPICSPRPLPSPPLLLLWCRWPVPRPLKLQRKINKYAMTFLCRQGAFDIVRRRRRRRSRA